ncbi:Membrane protein [Paraburkholderia piptadeniae]|uniref:Membrane protein n=2 Tax=Paraburkholderia piptadeniae TaxID=1701573 RepID=A0A1N7SNV5_9BURK|nr:Membrane protein [Paraburkholderia piptadeniae]
MAADYVPPVQKGFGQLVDSLFLLVLVYCSLLAPLLLKAPDKAAETQTASTQVSWRELGQNAAMEAQWRKLGYDAQQAKPIITTRFDYEIEPVSLIVTALVIVGYFVFVLRVSDRQYRQVIAEKFGE